ncbi:methylmalonyl-CoA epimerase [Salibacterium salarium]|uniref:methylmalonyl-CoA epimerase n=1 Tax=Salibacterium salarium TaxID=284579 RepID=UPI00278A8641|nr:methylmalonyl-CoA epimerase [Salibacterium salarium]MDQ0299553.1 methylmalonyl-CoA epimerase [Salibacterium salarium]
MKAPEGIDHVGIAVYSIDEHYSFYKDILGLRLLKIESVPSQKVKVAFFQIGLSKIELVEPQGPDSPVATFLDEKGEGLHHIGLTVSTIDERLKEIRKAGIKTIHDHYIKGSDNAKTAFLHPSSTGKVLYEFIEKTNKNNYYEENGHD